MEKLRDRYPHAQRTDFIGRALTKGFIDGEATGMAKAILEVLAARDIPVDDKARTRISGCTDTTTLTTWTTRAATATTVGDLFT